MPVGKVLTKTGSPVMRDTTVLWDPRFQTETPRVALATLFGSHWP